MTDSILSDASDLARHRDEAEQLRIALEGALEENARITNDRDRLLRRVTAMTRELQAANAAFAQATAPATSPTPLEIAQERRSQTEEELRVAFEELQVLTEELEFANTSLHRTNVELDQRVEERTREIAAANAALRTSEAAFRAITDLAPDLLWEADRHGQLRWCSQRWCAYTGRVEQDVLGEGWLKAVHVADRALAQVAWHAAVMDGEPLQREHRIRAADGSYRWFLARAEPLRNEQGEIVQWFGATTDVHDQRVALEELQRAELRFRSLVEGMPQMVWRAGHSGKWTWSSPQWTEFTGQSQEESLVNGWLAALHPDDRAAAKAAWARAVSDGRLDLESRIYNRQQRRYRHCQIRASPVIRNGEIVEWLGTSTDVDDMLQLQQRQQVLVAELQHRTRNLMAVVQAVTQRTVRGSVSLDDFRTRIQQRLGALGRVQALLSRRAEGARITFDELLHDELAAHGIAEPGSDDSQVTLTGPREVALRSRTVQTLALAVHELVTNAIKYGALKSGAGRLAIGWRVAETASAEPRLQVDWRESGVADMPDASAPALGSGYGRELIERALPYQLGCKTTYAFTPDGVHCTIDVAIPARTAE